MQTKTQGLGELLVKAGLISQEQLGSALAEHRKTGQRLGEILIQRGQVTQQNLLEILAGQLGHRMFDRTRDAVQPEVLDLIPFETANRHDLLPVRLDGKSLVVAIADPLDVEALDQLRRICKRTGRELELLIAPSEDLEEGRKTHYSRIEGKRSVHRLIDRVVDEAGPKGGETESTSHADAERHAQDASVINLVDQILAQASQERATDIHVEPQERGLVIRYRIDGMLRDALTPPRAVYTGVVSRIKILSSLDIAERRATQDGRFSYKLDDRDIDVRVSIIPTIHGEKVVLRLLDKSGFSFSLRDLGFSERDYQIMVKAIRQPHGMVLLSGPTGSGKSTTLYASLLELRDETLNVTTIEDPVEYQIDRITQVQVNERKQVTFARALRAFLRQDPDVIMVGEIRDTETAEIAVRAALTGHIVFSTIHANDAPATAARLVSMGVEPFMAASALNLVIAQRLVRRTCRHCLEEYQPSEEILLALGIYPSRKDEKEPIRFRRGAGCAVCKDRGYLGRVAIVEIMQMSPELRTLMAENRPASEIRKRASEEGMRSLRANGIEKVRAGTTTVDEVLRVCLSDDQDSET